MFTFSIMQTHIREKRQNVTRFGDRNRKIDSQCSFQSIYALVYSEPTLESHENTAVGDAILYVGVWVCGIMNKAEMCSRSVYYVMNLLFSALCC